MGDLESAVDESFTRGLLEYPHYTRPAEWRGRRVPDVLLSGHHSAVAAWRRDQSERTTRERRPDLWAAHCELSSRLMTAPLMSTPFPPKGRLP
jgi:tRNA (guanine37-N1)-methyltransferase